jgi:hypothetical protein
METFQLELQMWEKVEMPSQKTTAKESVSKPIDGGEGKGDVEVSDLDHERPNRKKGVLQWNSDIGAERVI